MKIIVNVNTRAVCITHSPKVKRDMNKTFEACKHYARKMESE